MSSRIREVIARGERFLITSHIKPDGDSLGSSMALYHALTEMGKQALVYNRDRTPANYAFLPSVEAIVHTLPPIDDFAAVFVLDCGDLLRVGEQGLKIAQAKLLINVDHHINGAGFAQISVNDSTASSTGELLYRLFKEISAPVSKATANCLYAAILTDTGGFRYANTKRETMLAAADLISLGANPQWVSENIYDNNEREKLLLLKKVLETLDLDTDSRIGSLEVRLQVFQEIGAGPEHTEGLVDLPRTIRGVEVAVLFTEIAADLVKVSLRSKNAVNIEPVARSFGGGGHMNAASCQVQGELAGVKRSLYGRLKTVLDAHDASGYRKDAFGEAVSS